MDQNQQFTTPPPVASNLDPQMGQPVPPPPLLPSHKKGNLGISVGQPKLIILPAHLTPPYLIYNGCFILFI